MLFWVGYKDVSREILDTSLIRGGTLFAFIKLLNGVWNQKTFAQIFYI